MADIVCMRSSTPIAACVIFLACALAPLACGTAPISTTYVDETVWGLGNAPYMYRYGQDLAAQGRLREAQAAFTSAETTAYSAELREAARIRRMYLERVIAALQAGKQPPPPPVIKKEPTSDQALAKEAEKTSAQPKPAATQQDSGPAKSSLQEKPLTK